MSTKYLLKRIHSRFIHNSQEMVRRQSVEWMKRAVFTRWIQLEGSNVHTDEAHLLIKEVGHKKRA